MNYITPEEVLTFLPKEILNSEQEADLISYIIRGYQRLNVPQDKVYREKYITTDNTYTIPDDFKSIISVQFVQQEDKDCDTCLNLVPVYPNNIQSDLCGDYRVCNNCQLMYSLFDRVLRVPTRGTYRIVYTSLYSDELKIVDNKTLIDYLVAYVNYQVSYNRARTSDVQQNLLNFDYQVMNNLYTQARGSVILNSIKLANHRLSVIPINLTKDEFNYRHFSA